MTKDEARKKGLSARDALELDVKQKADECIFEKILDYIKENNIEHVLCFVGFRSEPRTEVLIEKLLRQAISVYCPKVIGKDMSFLQISSLYDLEKGYQGIMEPEEDLPDFQFLFDRLPIAAQSVVIMPGAAFDQYGNRAGYGGGYYDRFLAAHSGIKTISICYQCQIFDSIDIMDYDKKTDLLLTETSSYSFS